MGKSRGQKYYISVLSRTEGKQVNKASGKIRHLRFIYADSAETETQSAATKRTTAALMCVTDGVGRRGSQFKRRDDHEFKAYFACHDDQGSGIDICFYKESTPGLQSCRNSVGGLTQYMVQSTGKFEVAFSTFRGKSILSGTLINDATRFQDGTFSLTDTDPDGNENTKTYTDEAPTV